MRYLPGSTAYAAKDISEDFALEAVADDEVLGSLGSAVPEAASRH